MNMDNYYVSQFKNVIEDIVKSEIKKLGITNYISAVVQKVNPDNTVNVFLPPNKDSVITGIFNKTNQELNVGDSVEIVTKNGSLSNAWVAIKHGKDESIKKIVSKNVLRFEEKDPTVPNYVKAITRNDIDRWNNGGYVAGDTFPIGAIAQYSGNKEPTNWLFCDGREVSRETYQLLFETIGTTYGSGDGSTTFNLPDFKSRVPMGLGTGTDINGEIYDTQLGSQIGEYVHKLTEEEMPSHNHQQRVQNSNGYTGDDGQDGGMGYSGAYHYTNDTSSTGGDVAHNNVQPSLGVNFIIKYNNSVGLVGTVVTDIANPNDNAAPSAKTVKDYVDEKSLYSQNETKIGMYEGKPLYRKVYTFSHGDSGTSDWKKIADTPENIDTIVRMDGVLKESNGNCKGTPYYETNNYYERYLFVKTVTPNYLAYSSASNGDQVTSKLIIEYTKTTD